LDWWPKWISISPFSVTCISDEIITYDYKNLRFEITIPEGAEHWKNTSIGSCSRYLDDIYCFGGINCTAFTDDHLLWTKYNLKTNTISRLNSTGIENVLSRELASITCIEKKKKCILGSGQAIAGGTIDQWVDYDIKKDELIILNPRNKPTNLQYISPDVSETWKIEDSDFKVLQNGPILMSGGDNASHILLSSDTIRYVAEFNSKQEIFIQEETDDLFTIKGQVLKNIPRLTKDDIIDETEDCYHFIEYAGKEQNEMTPFHYINEVVLYKVCH